MKVLNLYAGLGGNRKLWKDVEVTAVESNVEIARVYQEQNPDDIVIIGDAHDYLLKNANNFEFIWSSPPCQSHSRMIRSGRNRRPRYPDLKLYEEIIHLQYDYNGKWVVENVLPYYQPLIPYTVKVGRHLFWSNFDFEVEPVKSPKNLLSGGKKQARKEELMEWLDIYYEENIYYDGNHCPSQVLRNCVHPKIGQQIFEQIELNMASDNDEETKRKRDFQNWAKTGIMPNSQKNDFWTPQAVFDALNERFGPFTLDAAASEENALVTTFYTVEDNSLEQTWIGRIFINPPYVKQDDGTTIKDWVEKALDSVENGDAEVAVMLIPGYISNWYWHDTIIPKCSHIIIFRARLDFGGPYRRAGGASRQPSVGVVFSKAWSGKGVQYLRMSNRGEWLTDEIWDREILKIKLKNGVEAIGQILEGEKFVVLEGSTANADPRPSFRNTDKVWRDYLIDEGALVHDGKHMRFTRDVTFNSPSLAATIVRAVSSNGRKLWKATA